MIVMNDFQREYKHVKRTVDRAIAKTLQSGWYILGKEVQLFEEAFAQYIGVKYSIGVANGLEALQIALMALDVKKGDEVITVSHSAVATVLAITNIGAKPVFVDIDDFYHVNPAQLEKKITKKTKAILPVHLYGQIADMTKILSIAKKHNIPVVEDACQAHGAHRNGKKAGAFGALGCFSFYPTKNLGTYGDGGAITTNSKTLYRKCMMLRNYGQTNRYEHVEKGLNSRLDELHAAILTEKLSFLDEFIAKRNEVAEMYSTGLTDINEITLPKVRKGYHHAYHLFVIRVDDRVGLRKYLEKNGIQTVIHYPIPIHKQVCYEEFHTVSLPVTEKYAEQILSLPIHSFMRKAEVKKVIRLLKEYYEK